MGEVIYAVSALAVVFFAFWCFRLDGAQARFMFPIYRALGLARDRDNFARGYRLVIRAIGVIGIGVIVIGLALR
jgi:hypothetical protein